MQRPGGRQINISGLNDGTAWDPLDFALKEGYPDNLMSILASTELLYLFGTENSEIWQDTGDIFPFARIAGAAARFGAISPYTQAAIGGKVYFLGGDGSGGTAAYVLNSFTPQRVSTHAIEQQWNKQDPMTKAVAYSYLEEGHYFWVINGAYPGAPNLATDQAFAYDITSGTWTRRARWSLNGGKTGDAGAYWLPYDTRFHTYLPEWGMHITAGDVNGTTPGYMYSSSVNFYDDAGSDLHWERALPYQYEAGHQLFFDRLDVDAETGATASTSVAPTMELDWSDDRGNTFGGPVLNTPQSVSMGVHGDFTRRMYWNQLGGSRGRVFRLSGTGQSKVVLIDADLQMRKGSH